MFKYNGEQCVLEYQCSPISSEYFERHELYQAAGIKDIWICGTEKYLLKNENEKSKRFRVKEIEKNTFYYYDSEYKIFKIKYNMVSDEINTLCYKSTLWNDKYNSKDTRNYFDQTGIRLEHDGLFSNLSNMVFNNFTINVSNECIEKLVKLHDKINKERFLYDEHYKKCNNYLDKIIDHCKEKYNLDVYKMFESLGIKSFGKYFCINNIEEYPNISFNKINYGYKNHSKSYNFLFNFNIETTPVNYISDYLYGCVKDKIIKKQIYEELDKKYKQEYTDELNHIKNELSEFWNKDIYLLFENNKNKISKDIKYKFMKNYYNNELNNAKSLLSELKFLKKIKVNKIVLMIPRKKIKESRSFNYPYYKVVNYEDDVIKDFENLGFKNIKTYEDLLK